MSEYRGAMLTVADLLAKAAREGWPTSALSVCSHELGPAGDDTPTGPISMVRPYLEGAPMPARPEADWTARPLCPPRRK